MKVAITYGWKVAITHLEIYAKLISSERMNLYTQTIFWLMKSSTHPSSRSFTKEKEEIVQSDLQSLPNRIECDHMDDILWNSSKF
jgi:transposase